MVLSHNAQSFKKCIDVVNHSFVSHKVEQKESMMKKKVGGKRQTSRKVRRMEGELALGSAGLGKPLTAPHGAS